MMPFFAAYFSATIAQLVILEVLYIRKATVEKKRMNSLSRAGLRALERLKIS